MNRYVTIAGKRRHLRGARRSSAPPRMLMRLGLRDFIRPTRAVLPHLEWFHAGSEVTENQRARGKCVAEAYTSAAEYLCCLQGQQVEFSDDAFYALLLEAVGCPLTEDPGSDGVTAVGVAESIGFPLYETYPDDPGPLRSPSPWSRATAAAHRLGLSYACPSVATIEASIVQGRPVPIGFTCFESLQSDATTETGLIPFAPSEEIVGGHEILIVGYDRAARHFLILNSWGDEWGMKLPESPARGYGAFPYAYVEKSYAFDAISLRTMVRTTVAL